MNPKPVKNACSASRSEPSRCHAGQLDPNIRRCRVGQSEPVAVGLVWTNDRPKLTDLDLVNLPAAAHQNTPSNSATSHRTDRATIRGRTARHNAGVMALVNAFRWAAAGRMRMSRLFGTAKSHRRFTAYARGPLWPTLQPFIAPAFVEKWHRQSSVDPRPGRESRLPP